MQLNYKTNADIKLKKQLESLFVDWKAEIKTKDKIVFHEDNKAYDAILYFTTDGFLPGYATTKPRILFIGRESRYQRNDVDYLSSLWEMWSEGIFSNYWTRIFNLAYELVYGSCQKDFSATEIFNSMRNSDDFGFAIMNISKYTNDADDGANADYELINRSLEDSISKRRNFVREEIEILNPDIIITANLWDNKKISPSALSQIFSNRSNLGQDKNRTSCVYDFLLNGRTVKLLDMYHFSARGNSGELFYNPAKELLLD